ncbi:MAG TPA: two-component regulator propeller domain-containing protein [Terriglobia bacterium]|nr:two-component regulator propeller domain-containing protein [Terriglobia bacterium]
MKLPPSLARAVGAVLLASSCSTLSLALSPSKTFRQYVYTVWQTSEGLPQNTVRAIAQTPDGFLWLATPAGLVRFDGVNFRTFDRYNTPALPENSMTAVAVGRDGELWIGTDENGLLCLRSGKFTRYTTNDGLSSNSIAALFLAADGTLWIGTHTGGLNHLQDGRFTHYTPRDGLSGKRRRQHQGQPLGRALGGNAGELSQSVPGRPIQALHPAGWNVRRRCDVALPGS